MARAAVCICVLKCPKSVSVRLAPTTSTAALVMGDALAVALLKARLYRRGFRSIASAARWDVAFFARRRYYAYWR